MPSLGPFIESKGCSVDSSFSNTFKHLLGIIISTPKDFASAFLITSQPGRYIS